MTDHRDLLRRYIDHVGECEGVTFLSDSWMDDLEKQFTPTEVEILRGLESSQKAPDDDQAKASPRAASATLENGHYWVKANGCAEWTIGIWCGDQWRIPDHGGLRHPSAIAEIGPLIQPPGYRERSL